MPEMKKPQVLQHPGLRGNVEIYEETNVMHDHSTDVADVTPETVPAMVYAGHPVVTTALLARLYGAEAKHIQNNYARNNARFESGKHFFKVEGADLADLKNKPSLRGFVGVKAKSLILWTERGAARHAKMLETNEAWDVFEKLEDCYFGKFESARQVPAPANQTLLGTTIGTDGFHCLAAVLDGKVRHLPAPARRGVKNHIWSQVHKAFSVVTAEDIPADQLDSARNFIAAYALEGEWLPKDRVASAVDTCSWSNIAFLVDCVEKCWKIVESRRLATHLSGLGCNAGVELAGFLWDGLGSAAHVRKYCANELNWQKGASA